MRVTPANLLRIARETVQKQVVSEPGLVAAYLTGSLRAGDPLIGGAADIDLVFVHDSPAPSRREIVPLNPEIHLDILHNPRSLYDRPKLLRIHPWLGTELYDPQLLYESQHFFEFVQAGVRDKYNEPESIVQRSQALTDQSRQQWNKMQLGLADGPAGLLAYLDCLYTAANAVCLLGGSHISERRLLLEFPTRAEAAGLPALAQTLFHLCGAGRLEPAGITTLLADWESAFFAAGSSPAIDPRVVVPRFRYYKLAFESMIAEGNPQAVLFPLMLTWSLSIASLPAMSSERWLEACASLGLEGDAMDEKMTSLDHFLDSVEQALEDRSSGQNSASPYMG